MADDSKETEADIILKGISYDDIQDLREKLKTSICKIKCKDGFYRTGFFCNIQYGWDNILKVLMTTNHVLGEDDITLGKKISFSLNDENIFYEIEIDESRRIFTDKKYDITIIQIKQNDNIKIDKNSFLNIDERLLKENAKEIFKKEQIYLLHYSKDEKLIFSYGEIKNINEDNYTIQHLCNTEDISSGGPIINSRLQVIGIHTSDGPEGKNYNIGTFLKEPLEKFKNKIEKNENNKNENNKNENNKNENNKNEIKINNEKNKLINEDIEQIIIKYKIDDIEYSKNIRIFGDKFVENNKNKCKIIVNGNGYDLSTHLNINKKQLNNNILEIKLKGIRQITDMSYMFSGDYREATLLSSLPDTSKWNTSNVTTMECMFDNCSSLSSLPDISKWNTSNVTTMESMFYNCSSLSSLPDISIWNTSNVTNMRNMFKGCIKLKNIPKKFKKGCIIF